MRLVINQQRVVKVTFSVLLHVDDRVLYRVYNHSLFIFYYKSDIF